MIRFFVFILCVFSCGLVFAEDQNIHIMASGDNVLELADSRQLTFATDGKVTGAWLSPNGKHVVYITELGNLCVVNTSGGHSTILMDAGKYASILEQPEQQLSESIWLPEGNAMVTWAPNSQYFAVLADRYEANKSGSSSYLLVLSPKGEIRASLHISASNTDRMLWRQDSRQIVLTVRESLTDEGKESQVCDCIKLINVFQSTDETLYKPKENQYLNILGWKKVDKSILVSVFNIKSNDKTRIEEVDLNGRDARLIESFPRFTDKYDYLSPDGTYRAVQHSDKITIESDATDTEVRSVAGKVSFNCWAPDGGMFAYERCDTIKGEVESRTQDICSLWIANLQSHKFNHMLVASEVKGAPTWSNNGLKIGYISRGRLHVAELAWRKPDSKEKLQIGLPLTEQEEKDMLLSHGKEISLALAMYAGDWDGAMPQADVHEALKPYMRHDDLFFKPGTKQDVFTYYPHESMDNADTIIGTLDSPYSWKVAIYADGHTATVQK